MQKVKNLQPIKSIAASPMWQENLACSTRISNSIKSFMFSHRYKIIFLFLFTLSQTFSSAQTPKQISNIKIIGSAYGYLKYFYPAENVTENDWDHLLYFAIKNGMNCESSNQLKNFLKQLFQPITPRLILSNKRIIENDSLKLKHVNDTNWISHCYFWQHVGNGNSFADIYKSAIINKDGQSLLYPEERKEETVISKYLGDNVFISFPRVECIKHSSLQNSFQKDSILKITASKFPDRPNITDVNVRLVNIVKAWVVFRHFFPYWGDVIVDRDSLLLSVLNKSFTDKTEDDFLKTLQLMTAPLNDGHIQISDANTFSNKSYTVGFSVDWIENSIVVNHVYSDTLKQIKKGDVILKVGNFDTKQLLSQEKYLSGSSQYKRYLLMNDLFSGRGGSSVKVTFYNALNKQLKTIIVKRNILKFNPSTGEDWTINFSERNSQKIDDSTYYLDLRNITKDSLDAIISTLNNFKNIICDLRGYPPLYSIELLNHLLIKPDTAQHWLQTPLISFPDFKNVKYRYSGYKNLNPDFPTLTSKYFFLCNSSSISFTELLLAIIRQNKLGTIIGTPSAGTNGNINLIQLLDNYYCYYTGMRVVNPDGSKHHLIGIVPDVIVKPTISSLQGSKDNVFETALYIAQHASK